MAAADSNKISTTSQEGEELEETIEHGELELEPPGQGATFENPPDGGVRAWLIVLSCAFINAMMSIMQIMIGLSLVDSEMSKETGIDSETQQEINTQMIALVNLYAPIAALVMIYLGYKVTVCIGAAVVMTTLVFISYLGDDDTEKFIKFLIFGPVAIGMSFIKLGALIPVLEYFTTKRMKALFAARSGHYVGEIILVVIIITASNDVEVLWRKFLRGCSGLCLGIGLLGLTLEELKLTMKDNRPVTFVQKTVGLANKDILKNIMFWFTCVVYFFYQWGIETPQGQFSDQDMTGRLDFGGNLFNLLLLYALSQPGGEALGMFIAWSVRKVVYKDLDRLQEGAVKVGYLTVIFGVLVTTAFLASIGCFVAPEAPNFGYFFSFSLLFAIFFAFNEGLRDDMVPNEFGRDNVRIVEGLITMFVGLGGVITNEISAEIDDGSDNDWKRLFRYGGGMLLLSAAITSIILALKQSKAIDELQSKLHGNSVVPFRADGTIRAINSNEQSVPNAGNTVNNRQYDDRNARTDLVAQYSVQPGVNSGFQPYHRPFVQGSNQNSGVQPYQQPTMGYTNQNGGFNPQQQQQQQTLTIQYI